MTIKCKDGKLEAIGFFGFSEVIIANTYTIPLDEQGYGFVHHSDISLSGEVEVKTVSQPQVFEVDTE